MDRKRPVEMRRTEDCCSGPQSLTGGGFNGNNVIKFKIRNPTIRKLQLRRLSLADQTLPNVHNSLRSLEKATRKICTAEQPLKSDTAHHPSPVPRVLRSTILGITPVDTSITSLGKNLNHPGPPASRLPASQSLLWRYFRYPVRAFSVCRRHLTGHNSHA